MKICIQKPNKSTPEYRLNIFDIKFDSYNRKEFNGVTLFLTKEKLIFLIKYLTRYKKSKGIILKNGR